MIGSTSGEVTGMAWSAPLQKLVLWSTKTEGYEYELLAYSLDGESVKFQLILFIALYILKGIRNFHILSMRHGTLRWIFTNWTLPKHSNLSFTLHIGIGIRVFQKTANKSLFFLPETDLLIFG